MRKEDIKAIECKHVAYQRATDYSPNDLLLIKEAVHTHDGHIVPRIRFVENMKRKFGVTKKPYQNHQDKKEYEELDKLDIHTSTQVDLHCAIQRALGRRFPDPKKQLREVLRSPYVYGADLAPTTIARAMYKKKYPDAVSRHRVAVMDTERDVVFGTDETIIITCTMGKHKMIGVVKWWADRVNDLETKIGNKFVELLSEIWVKDPKGKGKDAKKKLDIIETRGGKTLQFYVADTPGDLLAIMMPDVHAMAPDLLAFWNINYDMPKLLGELERAGHDPKDVFCDPSVPERYRYCKYREGKPIKETASKSIPIHYADLWHVLECMAGFYCIDAMVLFKKIRTAKGNEPSFALDAILAKYLATSKLKFKEADHLRKLDWHKFMQKEYPVEYCIYALFDCISVELLDETTGDMGTALAALSDISDYSIFPSIPKRLVDILHYFYEDRGKMAGTCGADITSPLDDDVTSVAGWIVTLRAYLTDDNGLACIKEIPGLKTRIRLQTADSDIVGAYPTGCVISNGSKETTYIEVIKIAGVSERERRRAGINLTSGTVNAIDIAQQLFKAPSLDALLYAYEEDIKDGKA